ncbi:MAG: hypothetical protein H6Q23_2283, partial [Bacteroidetes bacterium]|nr:hypothetical protein [Bacteroidota bacterium]
NSIIVGSLDEYENMVGLESETEVEAESGSKR